MISGVINTYFKWIFHLPRPFWFSDKVTAYATETSFGAPSGHSQNSVAVWGLIASSIRKPWAWIVAVIIMFFVGLSRMVLGMHFYLDVLTGWFLGIVILWFFLKFEKPVAAWVNQKSIPAQLFIVLLISIGSLVIAQLIQVAVSDWVIPNLWVENATKALSSEAWESPFSMSGMITNAAVFLGLVSGAILIKPLGGFKTKDVFWKLIIRYVVGLIGVLIIWAGLDMVFPDGHDFIAYFFRYIRYGLAGLWISLGAPWIFVKVKLSQPLEKEIHKSP
jgi:hypothetical protein